MNGLERVHEQRMRGSMLIVAMGILALLSVMAIAFTRLVKLESDSSTNYLDMIRAELLAKSGQERAKVGLQDVATNQSYDSINDPWVFKDDTGKLAIGTLIEDAGNSPYSGSLGGIYGNKEGLSYKVKVIDCASQINLNGRQKRLFEMLDNLAVAVAKSKGVDNPLVGLEYKGSTGGKAIVAFRSALINANYSSKMQLLELFQESERARDTKDADKVGLEKYNIIKDYVTANSWINEKTVKGLPNPDPKIAPMFGTEPRSPININTATREILVACIQGLAGRGRYVGARISTQPIDQDAPEYHILPGEEPVSIDEIIDFVYVEPLTQDQAEKIAEVIDNRRTSRPFRSYADFEYFVDTVITAGMLPQYKTSLHPADDRDINHFKAWYEQAARDVIKANFNPNARPNHFNPSVSARLIVDKANLWTKDKDDQLTETHTTEFCFSSMGYFEITSLGHVLDRKDEIVAESKVRTIIKLFDTIMHTSQKEFELAQDDDKLDVTTYPQNVVAFKADGHEDIGYFELYPSEDSLAPQSADLYKLLVVKFDQENYDKSDELSIANGEVGTAMTVKPDPLSVDPQYGSNIKCALMPKDSDTLPDGIHFHKFGSYLPRLRYRASSPIVNGPSNPKTSGIAQGELNIPTYSGAIEFWIKPDFDSTKKVFAGYLSVSTHLSRTVGNAGDQRQYKGGTQMYLFKSTDGTLRLTRLYYESFFDATGKLYPSPPPYPGDFDIANPDSFPPYPPDRPYNPEPPATPPPKYPVGRPLPDVSDKLPPVHARSDILVDHNTWGGWKAGEWHHVMITWDDAVFENDMLKKNCCLRLIVDGRELPGVVYQYAASKAVLVNETAPADYMFIGGIHRNQKYPPKGIFKFGASNRLAITANATIDNFATYYENALTPSGTPPFRYPISGTYTNYITIPFPPGVDKVKVRATEYAAYAPAKFAYGANGIKNPVDLVTAAGERAGDVLAGGDAPGVVVRLFPAGNTGVTIGPGTELQRDPATGAASIGYEVTLMGLNPVGHAAPLVSPVFDSIQISYFLPREEVVLFEKVVE